jgi:hypothetical protein
MPKKYINIYKTERKIDPAIDKPHHKILGISYEEWLEGFYHIEEKDSADCDCHFVNKHWRKKKGQFTRVVPCKQGTVRCKKHQFVAKEHGGAGQDVFQYYNRNRRGKR